MSGVVRFVVGGVLMLAACAEKTSARSPHAIELAALTVTSSRPGAKTIEVKEDGVVLVDGNASGRIRGERVVALDGTPMLTVNADGLLVGSRIGPGFRFVGNELVTDAGAKIVVGSDGAIFVAKDRGTEVLAKTEGGIAKARAALVVTALWLTLPMYVTTDTSKAAMPVSTQ